MSFYKIAKSKLLNKIRERVKPPNLKTYYGQFGEDAAIQTYFINKSWDDNRSIDIKSDGFYVDIGAFSPILISNTYWFYEYGWSGINVEPFPSVINQFKLVRPRDINLSIAIGEKEGIQNLY